MGAVGSKFATQALELVATVNPTTELMKDIEFRALPKEFEYPHEFVLQSLSQEERNALLTKARANPVCKKLDPFTDTLYAAQVSLNGSADFDEVHNGEFNPDSSDLGKRALSCVEYGCFKLPIYREEANKTFTENLVQLLSTTAADLSMNRVLEYYDEKGDTERSMPVFFESVEECATYFQACFRGHMPPLGSILGAFCEQKFVVGDAAATALTGFGQHLLVAVPSDGGDWVNRQASPACVAPAGSAAVIDLSGLAVYEVREGYEQYGTAAFFSADKKLLGVWVEPGGGKMFLPPAAQDTAEDAEWQFAIWRHKCTLLYFSFSVGHLTWSHWMCSNTLVRGVREQLEFGHPLRRLLWPFTHNSITINQAATVKLASKYGAVSRVGSINEAGINAIVDDLAMKSKYGTFEEIYVTGKGQFPEGFPELPMVRDGRRLWKIMSTFVEAFLELHFHNPTSSADGPPQPAAAAAAAAAAAEGAGGVKPAKRAKRAAEAQETKPQLPTVESDEQVVAFWEASNTMMGSERLLGLPALSFESLRDYCVHCMFTVTAMHEMQGTVVMDVSLATTCSGRILSKRHFMDPKSGLLTKPPQASVEDWFRNQCVVGSTTTLPMPRLIPSMERASSTSSDPREAVAFQSFARSLTNLADVMEGEAATDTMPFGSFNPRRLEVSVSL